VPIGAFADALVLASDQLFGCRDGVKFVGQTPSRATPRRAERVRFRTAALLFAN
jgi:hypothetical protein